MGTLTVQDWAPTEECGVKFKRALDQFLQRAIRYLQRQEGGAASITWWLEFQRRGAPHVHCLATGRLPWQVFAEVWADCASRAGLGSWDALLAAGSRFERLRGGMREAMRYARKYARKREQKDVPDGYWPGRFWGVRGDRTRGSCQISASALSAAGSELGLLWKRMKDLKEQGIVRSIAWEYGAGEVYFWGEQADAVVVPLVERAFIEAVLAGGAGMIPVGRASGWRDG